MVSLLLAGTGAHAKFDSRHQCDSSLAETRYEFDPELRLDPERSLVWYRGATFPLTWQYFKFLRLIVDAPNQVATTDDVIAGVWGTREPADVEHALRQMKVRLIKKFKAIDPEFDKIRVKSKTGFYWKRTHEPRLIVGRVGAAKFVYEGYADGTTIPLGPAEHALLEALLRRQLVTAATMPRWTKSSFPPTACTLNRKFRAILGANVAVAGPLGLGGFKLNPNVR